MEHEKWSRELLVHSMLRSLIGFVLIETLAIWLTTLHPGGEPNGLLMVSTGVLGLIHGLAACCCCVHSQCRMVSVEFGNGSWCLKYDRPLPLFILTAILLVAMGLITFLLVFVGVELPIVQGANFCFATIYGFDRVYGFIWLKERISSSFEH